MSNFALQRIPYFPALKCLFDDPLGSEILSVIIYHQSKYRQSRFCKEDHLYLLKDQLCAQATRIEALIDKMILQGILVQRFESVLKKKDPKLALKEILAPDEYEGSRYLGADLNFICTLLRLKGFKITPKLLEHAADDSLDFYAAIDDYKLPLQQKLTGRVRGAQFDEASLILAQFLVFVANCRPKLFDKAVAPGWHMLLCPPAKPCDIAKRWTREGQRALDLCLTDGTFFMCDGDFIGNACHCISHYRKQEESMELACALLLAASAICPDLQFESEVSDEIYGKALALLEEWNNSCFGGQPVIDYFLRTAPDYRHANFHRHN